MSVIANVHERAMARVFDHIMANGRKETLFGEGPGRALDSYRRFSTESAFPCVLIEIPLLGNPSYDVIAGIYHGKLRPGDHLSDTTQTAAQAAVDWMTHWHGERPLELSFELDADQGANQRPGILCRHRGQLDAAGAFYEAIGEGWRAPLYYEVAQRLPREWHSEYAAVFPGRNSKATRLELIIEGRVRDHAAGNPAYIRDCFDAMGFSAYDQRMLNTIAKLIEMRPGHSMQFDILADGSLGETFSLASYFENNGSAAFGMFDDGGAASKLFAAYERLGISDERWHYIKGSLLATKNAFITERGFCPVVSLSLPSCTKAKWTAAQPLLGKFYLTTRVIVRRNINPSRANTKDW